MLVTIDTTPVIQNGRPLLPIRAFIEMLGGATFDASTHLTASLTVYAKWTINNYTVTFDKNGGTTDAIPASISGILPNATVPLPTTLPTKTGYTFDSWNTAADGHGSAFTALTPVTASITVYAQWRRT
jgi:uncharacterized repeat protein (TIGR02543 family)